MDNIYAPPTSNSKGTLQSGERTIPLNPISLSPIWCISTGWKLTTKNFGKMFAIITGPMILSSIIQNVIQFIGGKIDGTQIITIGDIQYTSQNVGFAYIASLIISSLFGAWVSAGIWHTSLKFIDGKDAEFSDIFGQGRKLLRLFGASIVFVLAISIGFLLLIVPGFIILTRYGFCFLAIIDKDLGIMDSFKYSSELTRSSKLKLVGLYFLTIGIALLGILALLVGLLWAYPVIALAYVLSYCYMHQGENCVAYAIDQNLANQGYKNQI
jgi:hypothetical protein